MTRTIALVSCVSEKNQQALPAKDLYCSEWFRKARRYAEANCDGWNILSAKYSLLQPDQPIPPYNGTLKVTPNRVEMGLGQTI